MARSDLGWASLRGHQRGAHGGFQRAARELIEGEMSGRGRLRERTAVIVRVDIAPSLYEWASERSGVDADELHRKFPKLPEWEAGDQSPTPEAARRVRKGNEDA